MYSGDSLTYHVGSQFSTFDQDNDEHAEGACAVNYKGAWWYKECHNSNLNGYYYGQHQLKGDGVVWNHWHGHYSLRFTEMKIRLVIH